MAGYAGGKVAQEPRVGCCPALWSVLADFQTCRLPGMLWRAVTTCHDDAVTHRGTGETAQDRPASVTLFRIGRVVVYLVYGLAVVSVVILVIAFFLKLFAANPEAPFVEWIYRSTERVMQPFRGIFPAVESEGGSVLDVSLLFAMLMYGLLALAVHALVEWINRRLAQMGWDPNAPRPLATTGSTSFPADGGGSR
jgi:uncharacterized protein YggT (Ycf19 family)